MGIDRNHYPLLLAICASMFTTPLMAAGVNAILPELRMSFGAGATALSLVGTAYALGLAVFQLACGSLGDIWGHRRVFMLGAAIFAGASALACLPASIEPFIFLRFLQGMGGAMLSATGLALVAAAAPVEHRPAYLGATGAAVYSGIACGPPVAGFVTGAFGWHWLFVANACANVLVLLIMRLSRVNEWRPAPDQPFDWGGCAIYAGAMIALTYGAAEIGRSLSVGGGAFLAFAALLAIFCARQRKAAFPMLNLALLAKNRIFALSCAAAFVNYASFFGIIFYFSFYLQVAQGLSVQMAGLVLAFQPIMQAFAQPAAARLCRVWDAGGVCAVGSAICGAGLIACAFLTLQSPLYTIFIAQSFLGCGISMFALANTAIILESAGQRNIGQASGMTGAMRTLGQLMSMTLITLTMSLFLGNAEVSVATLDGFMRSMRINLVLFGLVNLMAVGIVLARNKSQGRDCASTDI